MFSLLLYLVTFSFATDYFIQEGDHYSTPRKIEMFRGSELSFKVKFVGDVSYDLQDLDQYDVNKLYGTSDCGDTHHKNSARIGWRWLNGKIELLAYTYVNGSFQFEKIGDTAGNKIVNLSIALSSDKAQYIFKMDHLTRTMPRGCSSDYIKGLKLYPYFGGNKAAPKKFHIQIDEKNQMANFSLEKIYPNPTSQNFIKLKILSLNDYQIGFEIFDIQGRLVLHKSSESFYASEDESEIEVYLENIASGVYLIRPYTFIDNERAHGFVAGSGQALKFIVL
jgi:hypothetical protein